MKTFLFTLSASVVASVLLWNFGVAQRISHTHPMLITLLIATGFGLMVQGLLTQDTKRRRKTASSRN